MRIKPPVDIIIAMTTQMKNRINFVSCVIIIIGMLTSAHATPYRCYSAYLIRIGDNNTLKLKYLSVRQTPYADVTSSGYAKYFAKVFLARIVALKP